MAYKARPIAERFWEKVRRGTPEECWPWMGARQRWGHGLFAKFPDRRVHKGKNIAAHRMAWELTFGPIPAGFHVCHRCDNPPCCNPHHLFLGTNTDNRHDSVAKERASAKLTWEQVTKVRTLYASGHYSRKQLAEMFGVSSVAIRMIVLNKTWRIIPYRVADGSGAISPSPRSPG